MISYHEITHAHIELSSYCNASCPKCARNFHGSHTLPWLPQVQISLEEFIKFFPPKFISNLKHIVFCGNYGDPATAQDLLEIVQYIRKVHPGMPIQINTNGGIRSPEFWAKLAKNLTPNSNVTFSIDGLEDTNHIYRKGVAWDTLIKNVEAFIQNGGKAYWDYLIFRHNEHQIEEAKQLSHTMGFEKFFSKKALGFHNLGRSSVIAALNKDLSFAYHILPPSEKKFQNEDIKEQDIPTPAPWTPNYKPTDAYLTHFKDLDSIKINPEFEKKANSCQINCHAKRNKEVFISSEGLVFPCCFIASQYYQINYGNFEVLQTKLLYTNLGKKNHSLHLRTLEQIIEDTWFQETFTNSWEKPTLREGRLSVCSSFCGDTFHTLETTVRNKVRDL